MRFFRTNAVTFVALAGGLALGAASIEPSGASARFAHPSDGSAATKSPIKHLVVIFDENVSFDHYFATYPVAANPPGEPAFVAAHATPSVNGLASAVVAGTPTGPLLTHNGNASNPIRLDPTDSMTCDQDHAYPAEQLAADSGAEDKYVQNTGNGATLAQCLTSKNAGLTNKAPIPANAAGNDAVMDYYDGNTVTALWNYAQHFSMSDNAFGTTYGPSTPGALNVTSAQTFGTICGPTSATINDAPCTAPPGLDATSIVDSAITTSPVSSNDPSGSTSIADQPAPGPGTDYSDADPAFDICSYLPGSDGGDGRAPASTIELGGNNIGEELSSTGITWGWFEGGFDNGYVPGQGTPPTTAQVCSASHTNVGGASVTDYIPHHEPFQYYASTANPMHLPPTSLGMIGHNDQANHQYDLADFWAAADASNLPQVSYLKAPAYEDGHAGYSDPLDEQNFLVKTINRLEALPSWSSTAVMITWDDSDGWYDHVLAPVVTGSQTPLDALTGSGACGSTALVPTTSTGAPEEGKCGLGPRLPFLVVSPFARANAVSNNLIDQSSVVRFIEYNWQLPALGNGAADAAAGSLASLFDFHGQQVAPIFLDPTTGEPQGRASRGPGY